jgi:hypothetical protein
LLCYVQLGVYEPCHFVTESCPVSLVDFRAPLQYNGRAVYSKYNITISIPLSAGQMLRRSIGACRNSTV